MGRGRHGNIRKKQAFWQNPALAERNTFVVESNPKKYKDLSPGRWRAMFPELITYSDSEVARAGMELLKRKEGKR